MIVFGDTIEFYGDLTIRDLCMAVNDIAGCCRTLKFLELVNAICGISPAQFRLFGINEDVVKIPCGCMFA